MIPTELILACIFAVLGYKSHRQGNTANTLIKGIIAGILAGIAIAKMILS